MADPAIFFVPHQDDEVLSMGGAIVEHVQAGRRVLVVLCTDGSASGVRDIYPSVSAFVAERDREFIQAVTTMGAEPIIDPHRAVDGTLTEAYARTIMARYKAQYDTGSLSLKTMSYNDTHKDHDALGEALKSLDHYDKRYYLPRSLWNTYPGKYTQMYNLRDALLDYAPVGWLSVRAAFEATWVDGKSKVHS